MTNTKSQVQVEIKGQTFAGCGCECGAPVNGKSLFRQGHDARLVSRAAQFTVLGTFREAVPAWVNATDERDDIQYRIDQVTGQFNVRFSEALASKYNNAAMNLWTKTVDAKGSGKPSKATRAAKKAAKLAAAEAPAKAEAEAAMNEETVSGEPVAETTEFVPEPMWDDAPVPSATETFVGSVKKGRWFYDATKTAGKVTWTDKAGLQQEASEAVAATFQANGVAN